MLHVIILYAIILYVIILYVIILYAIILYVIILYVIILCVFMQNVIIVNIIIPFVILLQVNIRQMSLYRVSWQTTFSSEIQQNLIYLVGVSLLVVVLQQVRPVGGEELQQPVDGGEGGVVGRNVVAVEEVQQDSKRLEQYSQQLSQRANAPRGLYYQSFTIVFYDRNDSGQYCKTTITIVFL